LGIPPDGGFGEAPALQDAATRDRKRAISSSTVFSSSDDRLLPQERSETTSRRSVFAFSREEFSSAPSGDEVVVPAQVPPEAISTPAHPASHEAQKEAAPASEEATVNNPIVAAVAASSVSPPSSPLLSTFEDTESAAAVTTPALDGACSAPTDVSPDVLCVVEDLDRGAQGAVNARSSDESPSKDEEKKDAEEQAEVGQSGTGASGIVVSDEAPVNLEMLAREPSTVVTAPDQQQSEAGRTPQKDSAVSKVSEDVHDNQTVSRRVLNDTKAKGLLAEAKTLVQDARRKTNTVAQLDVLFSGAIEKQREALDLTIGASFALAEYGATLLTWAKCDLNGEYARDRLEESSRALALALEKVPTDEASLFNRGLCMCLIAAAHSSGQGLGLYAEACRMYDKLLDLNSSSRVGAFNCGLAYISRARLAEADTPGSADVVEFYVAAKERFERVVALQPEDKKAKEYLLECDKALMPPTGDVARA
jgi:tetratricopeptide (TPR) repeat protein